MLSFKDLMERGSFNELHFPPLSLGVITSYLRSKGYTIEQNDLNVKIKRNQLSDRDPLNKFNLISMLDLDNKNAIFRYLEKGNNKNFDSIISKLLSRINVEEVDILLLSLFVGDPRSSFLALCIAKYIKDRRNDILIIVGGEQHNQEIGPGRLVTIKDNIDEILDLKVIDYYISGAGEISLVNLFEAIEKNKDFSEVPGLVYRDNGDLKENDKIQAPVVVPDFDGLPLKEYIWKPNPILLNKISNLKELEREILMLPLQFIIGCINKCAFCQLSHPKLRLKVQSPKDTVKNLKYLSNKYQTKYFFFLNSCLNISKKYTNELCNEIIENKLNILWSDCARADNLDKETVFKMRQAGAVRLVLGLETASERMLKYLNKGVSLTEIENTLRWSQEAGIWSGVELISGLPHETEEDVELTVRFLESNAKNIDQVFLNPFYLEPNSAMALFPEKYGITNIRRVGYSGMKYFNTPAYNLSFDEINGLPWEEKQEQQWQSQKKICSAIERLGVRHPEYIEDMHVLFFLYSYYSKKSRIKEIFYEYFKEWDRIRKANIKKRKRIHLIKRPYLIPLRLLRIRSFKEFSAIIRRNF